MTIMIKIVIMIFIIKSTYLKANFEIMYNLNDKSAKE